MGKPEPLAKALNFSSLMLGMGAVMAGNASAHVHGNAEFFPATICLLFVIFTQLAANAYHRYNGMLNFSGAVAPSLSTLGKRPDGERLLFYRVFSIGFMLLSIIAGLTLLTMGGIWFGLVGVLVAVLGWGMVGGKSPLLLSTWGFVFTFILFGPLTVISTSLLQSSHEAVDPLSWFDISPALFMGCSIGFMAANVYLCYVYATFYKNKQVMRETFPATYGRRATRNLFLVNSILAAGVLIFSCFYLSIDRPWLAALPSLACFGINIYIWRKMDTSPGHKLMSLATWACFNVLLMGLLASVVSIFVGIPDDSHLKIF